MKNSQPQGFQQHLLGQCQAKPRSIVFPEGNDPRVQAACRKLLEQGACKSIGLLGDEASILESLGAACQDPRLMILSTDAHDLQQRSANHYTRYLKGKNKAVDDKAINAWCCHPANQAATLLSQGDFDAALGGCLYTTATIIRAALQGVGMKEGVKTISGSFAMIKTIEQDEIRYMFGDCGVVIQPTVDQLVDIASETLVTARQLFPHQSPKVAFLSFSTKGSASHPLSSKIQEAAALFQQSHPQVPVDGELQFDAAIDKDIGRRKAPGSTVAGDANCFIFPDLNAGNIAYKITQRLGGFEAFGPILQGTTKPYSDLSRGATAEDIFTAALITMLRCEDEAPLDSES